jgi:signal transduction histidine kinase
MAGDPAAISVELPMWRALSGYRLLTLAYAVGLFFYGYGDYGRPWVGLVYLGVLAGWTLATFRRVFAAERCSPGFLVPDLLLAVGGILLSPVADPAGAVGPTLPSIWSAGPVLAIALKAGWRGGAAAAMAVGAANFVEDGEFSGLMLHNVVLVCVAAVTIGYVVEVARASERALAKALRIEAAIRERERLARGIHDSVLQVLAMVQRRGTAIGGEAAELGLLAGEQERALRALVSDAPPEPDAAGEPDLGALLAGVAAAGERVTYAGPGAPVPLPAPVAREMAAAVGAALDNVRRHAGERAHAWILLEEEPDGILVTVRDDGPGIPEGRLAAAEAEGRLGAALSIAGRLRDLGGSAAWLSPPGQGTEVELRLPEAVRRKGRARA